MIRALLLGCLCVVATPASACPDAVAPAASPAVCVAHLVASKTPAETSAAHDAVRALGPAALASLTRAEAAHREDAAALKRLQRARRVITEDFHRAKLPPGMVYVPAGPVELPRAKKPGPSGERKQLRAFYIDRLETTVGAWRAWIEKIEKLDAQPGATWRGRKPDTGLADNLPACGMTHTEACRYAREARRGRLPSVLEFHRALRGSGLRTYPWGEVARAAHANLDFGQGARLLPVGSFPSGASPFGVLDLVGNVAEWTSTSEKFGTAGTRPRVWAGAYLDTPGKRLTWQGPGSGSRSIDSPSASQPWIGIRIAIDPPALPGQ